MSKCLFSFFVRVADVATAIRVFEIKYFETFAKPDFRCSGGL